MKYPYLSDEKKARMLTLILTCSSALLCTLNILLKKPVLQCLAALIAVVFFGYAMHYMDFHNVQGQSIKKYVLLFHTFAVHALLYAFEGFAGAPGTLSYQVFHGLVDAVLAVSLLALARLYQPELSLTLMGIVGAVTFLLTLFNVNVVLNLVLIALGCYALYVTYVKTKKLIFYPLILALFALAAILAKDNPLIHDYLHLLAIILGIYLAWTCFALVGFKEAEEAPVTRGPVASEPKKEAEPAKVLFPDFDEPEDSWFIKKYQHKPYEDLLNAPLTAFNGVSQKMADDMDEAFGIKTIGDLADNKFFQWAKEIVDEAKK